MAWTQPQHTRAQVDRAGKSLQDWNSYIPGEPLNLDEYIENYNAWQELLEVVNNWRSSHSYPLNTFQINLRRAARAVDGTTLIAQRIKRLSSISHKLDRFPRMRLSQMQDIGGCRAVLKSVAGVRQVEDYYLKQSQIKHTLKTHDDYITNPQKSGYRGVHLIYQYFSDNPATQIYNGLQIEMQLRSQYQHAWATAVETVGTFVRQALKSSLGGDDWLRFFALMGTAIAMRERTTPVPDTPTKRSELVAELSGYAQRLNIENRLSGYTNALQRMMGAAAPGSHFYLLKLDTNTNQLTVDAYSQQNFDRASKDYLEAEAQAKGKDGIDAVLVSVDSLAQLERAYPNYFADTRVFVQLMNQALTGRQRKIEPPQLGLGI